MSAFVVSKHDIDILVTAFVNGAAPAYLDATKIGRMLWRYNVKSVAYRYNMPDRHAEEHLGYLKAIAEYSYEPIPAKPAAIAKIARCYDYQTCETPDYPGSRAEAIAEALMAAFPATLAGYDDAPWGIADERDLERARV